jgi:Na+-driven multidrug efflux pump
MSSRSASQRIVTGPLASTLARFGVPLALGMALQTTFNLVDAYLISRLDADVAGPSLGAIGICDQIAAVGSIVSYGISTATAALVAQYEGRGDREAARQVAWQSMIMVTLWSAVFGVLGLGGAGFIMRDLVGAKGQVAEL